MDHVNTDDLISWKDGTTEIAPSVVGGIVTSEMKAANVPVEGAADSLFATDIAADLLLGVRVDGLQGRFCLSCGRIGLDGRWRGAVVMDARWEVYSSTERKVVATIVTHGGFAAKEGLEGEPERLIYEAFRDNVRGLIASDDFRRIVVSSAAAQKSGSAASPLSTRIDFTRASPTDLAAAPKSVAVVYSANGAGSGFLISREGYLLTNHHVVGGSKYVKVKWPNNSEALGEVLRSDPRRDVALVKVDARDQPALAFRTGAVAVGEAVFAIGTPLTDGLQNTMTKGIVSATRVQDGLPYIQSDVAVTHGNSGGPLLDEKGQVIGLTVSGMAPNGSPIGLNFFIPIEDALRALALTPAGPAPSETVAAAATRDHTGRKP
jgi:S1-C subfamily serine protease